MWHAYVRVHHFLFFHVEHSFTWLAHDRMEPKFRFVLSTCGITDTSITVLEEENVSSMSVFVSLTLSVTDSASAPDRRFPATLLHACVILSKSTHPFHPAHARCGHLSFCRFTDLHTASVPAFQPAQTVMTCLTQSGPCCFFY